MLSETLSVTRIQSCAKEVPVSFLMSPPNYYDAFFLFNPWMSYQDEVDRKKALQQWKGLKDTISSLGVEVRLIKPVQESPPMVFTADVALVYALEKVLVMRNDGSRSFFESSVASAWFKKEGFTVEGMPPTYRLDGGNIIRLSPTLYLVGLKPGSSGESERYLAKLFKLVYEAKVHPLALCNKHFLHLDMVIGNLGGQALLVYWEGLHPISRQHLRQWIDIPIIPVGERDAEKFACNSITVGDTVITGPVSENLAKRIEAFGFKTARLDLSEFYKAGGGAKCLTLPTKYESSNERR